MSQNATISGGNSPRGLAHRYDFRKIADTTEDGRALFVITTVYIVKIRLPRYIARCRDYNLLLPGKENLRSLERELKETIERYTGKARYVIDRIALEGVEPIISLKVFVEDESYNKIRAHSIRTRINEIVLDFKEVFRTILLRGIESSPTRYFHGYFLAENDRIRFRPTRSGGSAP